MWSFGGNKSEMWISCQYFLELDIIYINLRELVRIKMFTELFSVVMWEILEKGAEPYPGMSNQEVVDEVAKGYRLPKPEHCSDSIYQLMLQCWNQVQYFRNHSIKYHAGPGKTTLLQGNSQHFGTNPTSPKIQKRIFSNCSCRGPNCKLRKNSSASRHSFCIRK